MFVIRGVFRFPSGPGAAALASALADFIEEWEDSRGLRECRVTIEELERDSTVILEGEALDFDVIERQMDQIARTPEAGIAFDAYLELGWEGFREIYRIL